MRGGRHAGNDPRLHALATRNLLASRLGLNRQGMSFQLRCEATLEDDIRTAVAAEFGPSNSVESYPHLANDFDANDETGGIHPRYPDRMMTLQEIGDALGITRERVRQLEESGLRKLRSLFADSDHALPPRRVA